MKGFFLSTFFALFFSCSNVSQPNGIIGLWKSRDQESDKPRSLVAIYKYQNMYYGRMLATYDENGNIKDTLLEKKEKAPGIVGHPPYCGMDFVYEVKKEEGKDRYKGKIVDPEKGKIYDLELWREGDHLVVRGELWIFGKNIPWSPASYQDLPKGFSKSELKKFVPVVPQII